MSVSIDLSGADLARLPEACVSGGLSYQIFDEWKSNAASLIGGECGEAVVGYSYDPTIACGPNSANPSCASQDGGCVAGSSAVEGEGYACDPLSNFRSSHACEVSDLSGKFGAFRPDDMGEAWVGILPNEDVFNDDGSLREENAFGRCQDNLCIYEDRMQVPAAGLHHKSVVVSCAETGERAFCARFDEADAREVRRPVYNLEEKLDMWSADQTKDTVYRDNFVFGVFREGGVTGYASIVDMNDLNHGAQVSVYLDFSDADLASLPGGEECVAHGLTYHIHSEWNHPSLSSQWGEGCALADTGGHFDPTLACSASSSRPECLSQGGAESCVPSSSALDEVHNPEYTCNPEVFESDPFACEIGDLSGKHGVLTIDPVTNIASTTYPDAFLSHTDNMEDMSIVFHCNTEASERAFCAKIEYKQFAPDTAAIKSVRNKVPLTDTARAEERVPRDAFKGHDLKHANAVLNQHLKRNNEKLSTKKCEDFTIAELQKVQSMLYAIADSSLLSIYVANSDPRKPVYENAAHMEAEFAKLVEAASGDKLMERVLRDSHCHQAVMWFVHHITADVQEELAQTGVAIPLLPVESHVAVTHDKVEHKDVVDAYAYSTNCQYCHLGGIERLGPWDLPPNENELGRICDEGFEEGFGRPCGPCDGIGGIYWGDSIDQYAAPACSVVGTPEQIPEEERVVGVIPNQFVAQLFGGDRFGRVTNPQGGKWRDQMYSQIAGKWMFDFDGQAAETTILRHDTHYKDESFHWFNWTAEEEPQASGWVSQLHEQTKNMESKGNPGPMVSLMSEKNCPGQDVGWKPDGHFDNGCGVVRIGKAGVCNCIYDPVGMVDAPAATLPGLADMTYKGRILIDLEYDEELPGVYPDYVEMDHWVTYFFHIFMRTDNPEDPLFGMVPIRLASAYAGFAVYHNWTLADPTTVPNFAVDVGGAADSNVWSRGIPTGDDVIDQGAGPPWTWGKYCNNAQAGFQGVDVCNDVMNTGRDVFPLSADLEWEEWDSPYDKKEATEQAKRQARMEQNDPARHMRSGHLLPAFRP